jgi:MFS family permease
MVAEAAPRDRLAASIGAVQTAQRLGPALGPVIGAALAQVVGLRNVFLVSSMFYFLGFLLVLFFYRDVTPPGGPTQAGGQSEPAAAVAFRSVLAFENFVLLMCVIFGLQFVERSFGPILPLYLTAIGVPLANVAVTSGVMFSLSAIAGAIGNTFCATLIRRVTARVIIGVGGLLAGAAVLTFVVVPFVPVLYVASTVLGVAIGASMTAAYTAGGGVIPPEARATGFGFLTAASLFGISISPIVAGIVARTSMIAVFVFDAIVLGAVGVAVTRLMAAKSTHPETPVTEEV